MAVVATANVFEAARQGGANRVIFFSSMHVNGLYERDAPYSAIAQGNYQGLTPDRIPLVTHEMPVRPDGPYAVSKIFGEALGRYYAEEYGMVVICVRLGTAGEDDRPVDDARSYVSWVSHRDLADMVERCIDVEGITYDIFYGASDNTWKIYDTPVHGESWASCRRTMPRISGASLYWQPAKMGLRRSCPGLHGSGLTPITGQKSAFAAI